MSVLAYNEITLRKYIVLDGAPYEVLDSHVFRKQMRKPVNQTKLKNLISGKVVEHAFHQAETAHEADIETRKLTYIFKKPSRAGGMEYWFSPEGNPKDRFMIPHDMVGSGIDFIKENTPVEVQVFDEKVIGLKVPIKVTLKVTEAPPSVRGNTVQGGTKQVTLETGATVNTPLFVETGDLIVINTDTREYVERG